MGNTDVRRDVKGSWDVYSGYLHQLKAGEGGGVGGSTSDRKCLYTVEYV